MRNPGGYICETMPSGRTVEADTFTCAHCNGVTRLSARQRPEDAGGFCTVCAGLVCSSCVGRGCYPLERRLEEMEARYHALRSYES